MKTFGQVVSNTSVEEAKNLIHTLAEERRLKYITSGTGKGMVYRQKQEEAPLALADPNPTAEKYPMLASTVGIDGDSIHAVANVIQGMTAAWLQIGSSIERTSAQAIADLDAGISPETVLSNLVWEY